MRFKRRESGLLAPEEGLSMPRLNLRGVERVDPASMGTLVGAQPPPTQTYIEKVLSYSPLAYWPLNETSGTVADNAEGTASMDGAYLNTPTLNQAGIGDGEGAPLFAPVSVENVNIYSAALRDAWDFNSGTVQIWARVRAASVWSDSTYRCFLTFGDYSTEYVQIGKTNAANTLRLFYYADATADSVTTTLSTTDWFHLAMTWDLTADELKFFVNGSQVGSTQTGLGVWNAAFTTSGCRIAAAGPNSWDQLWDGYAAHPAVFTSVLSDPNIADLATLG
ncbi:MAG TPA: hypothetical protein VJK02_17390 [Anaerolineales bacterium]|nr:hypothetical protein [Anaerolineales bacterium]